MKRFDHLKPEHIEGLSWWFWFRENLSYINYTSGEFRENYRGTAFIDLTLRDLGFIIFGIPFGYCLAFFIGWWFRRNDARSATVSTESLDVFNKKNIEYFTVLTMLTGDTNGH